ncbi:MAG: NAD-dependent epimerase/dehydratase family protein [Spirochaetia bacterium]
MGESFILRKTPIDYNGEKITVAVTGAAGRIGRSFIEFAGGGYHTVGVIHPDEPEDDLPRVGKVVKTDITDLKRLKEAFTGCDAVVHLAADPSPRADWESVSHNNISGTYSVFVAAKSAGCRKVVFASSIHAVSGYPREHQVHPDEPVNPGDLYGVSKCFGEAMARFMATQHDLPSIAVRIGGFKAREKARETENIQTLRAFVSRRDLDQLLKLCVDDRHLQFAILHGLSDNVFNRMDTTSARELLGYHPEDSFLKLNRYLADLELDRKVSNESEKGKDNISGIQKDLEK